MNILNGKFSTYASREAYIVQCESQVAEQNRRLLEIQRQQSFEAKLSEFVDKIIDITNAPLKILIDDIKNLRI